MKKLLLTFCLLSATAAAQNPIIQTSYTADPAPMVHNDRLYLYTSHDEAGSTWFTMDDWHLYSTADMVNWTEHRVPLSYKTFEWSSGDAWAIQCIERNGRFYLYAPVTVRENHSPAIGVAVADSPFGPFYDALGKPLVQTKTGDIDPTVFIDDDGQAYLYWGNPNLFYVRLNEDMITYSGEVVQVPLTEKGFARRTGDPRRNTTYEEGSWLYKRNKKYYLFFAGGPLPEHLAYATADHPTGEWAYGGVLMPAEGRSFTNHSGIVDYKGNTYLFYHNGDLPGGNGFNRSVCVDQMQFNKDGSIVPMKMNKDGIGKGLATLNPYLRNEAETIAWSEGFTSKQNEIVGVFVTAQRDGAYIKVRDVDFKQASDKGGAPTGSKFTARLGTTHNAPVTLEVRLDAVDGKLLGEIRVPRTGGDDRWALRSIDVPAVAGIHDLYFVVKGSPAAHLMYFDYWMFTRK